MKLRRQYEIQSEHIIQVDSHTAENRCNKKKLSQKKQKEIDDKQISCHRRYSAHNSNSYEKKFNNAIMLQNYEKYVS